MGRWATNGRGYDGSHIKYKYGKCKVLSYSDMPEAWEAIYGSDIQLP